MEPKLQPVSSARHKDSIEALSKNSEPTQHAFFLFSRRLFARPLPRFAFVLLILVILRRLVGANNQPLRPHQA